MLEQADYTNDSGKKYTVKLEAIVCDAPAQIFVKCIKGHAAYENTRLTVYHIFARHNNNVSMQQLSW